MIKKRRMVLKGGLAVTAVGVSAGTGLLSATTAHAARPDSAFASSSFNSALRAVAGTENPLDGDIALDAPQVAQNPSSVLITIESTISGVREIALLVAQGNASPLNGTYVLGPNTLPYVATRIKMAESSDVVAVVKTRDQAYSTRTQVLVPEGDGCV